MNNKSIKARNESLKKSMTVTTFTPTAPIVVIDSEESLKEWLVLWTIIPTWLACDTETIGLDALENYVSKDSEGNEFAVDTSITTIQYFDGTQNILINIPKMFHLGLEHDLKSYLNKIHDNKDVTLVFYNAGFDLKAFLAWGIFTRNTDCLMLGAGAIRRYASNKFTSLKAVAKDLLDFDMDKEVRETFLCPEVRDGILTDDQLKYAVQDVEILAPLYYKIVKLLGASHELDSWKLSSQNLIGTSYLSLGGVPVDNEKLDDAIALNDEYLQSLEVEKISRGLESYNFNSPQQIKRLFFEKFNIELVNTALKTLQATLSDAQGKPDQFASVIDDMTFVVRYRERNTKLGEKKIKVVTPNFYQKEYRGLHVFTYNLHTNSTLTGRHTSTGSKKKKVTEGEKLRDDELRINAANIAGTLRPCTRVPKGFKVIGADFTAIEVLIVITYANEFGQIKAVNDGLDIHKYAASIVYQIEYGSVTPKQRQAIKGVVFKMLYGGSAKTDDEKEAQKRYFAAFPKLSAYLKERVREAKLCGYIKLVSGKRRYLSSSKENCNMYGYRKSVREALNAPMQGGCADIIKHSLSLMTRKLHSEGILNKVLGGVMVYDELMFIVKDEYAAQVAEIMSITMTQAQKYALPDIVKPVAVDIARHWSKANYETLINNYIINGKYDDLEYEVKKNFGDLSQELRFIKKYKEDKDYLGKYLREYRTTEYEADTVEALLKEDII